MPVLQSQCQKYKYLIIKEIFENLADNHQTIMSKEEHWEGVRGGRREKTMTSRAILWDRVKIVRWLSG